MNSPLVPDAPLADRMRPSSLEQFVGQPQLTGEGGFVHKILSQRRLPSLILWGPPGTGKTTLARLLAKLSGAEFFPLSAVMSGVKEVREIVARASELRQLGRRSVLFIDEIHRFHRGQQDALLPHVENGTIVLLGATTENPAHSIVAPLISRCRVLVLEPLDAAALQGIVARGLAALECAADPAAIELLIADADGDARRALTTLEIAAMQASGASISPADVARAAQLRALRSDRQGDAHYDLASALIKSLRGSDPDAAVYYLMRMIETGEDPRFAARRMLIFAAEDIGLADPQALGIALAAAQSFDRLGLPEGSLPLAEAALYLATAPKSNAVIVARNEAAQLVRERGTLPVPDELRDGTASLSRQLGLGQGSRYPHDEPEHHAPVHYLPQALRGTRLYRPSNQGREQEIERRLSIWRAAVDRANEPDR
jgi:putative ATPase